MQVQNVLAVVVIFFSHDVDGIAYLQTRLDHTEISKQEEVDVLTGLPP